MADEKLNGIRIHPVKLSTKVKTGAPIKTIFVERRGTIFSFNKALSPSAIGWSKPQTPTTFGPRRR